MPERAGDLGLLYASESQPKTGRARCSEQYVDPDEMLEDCDTQPPG